MKEMTPKQRAFVEAYRGNATEAAIAAGYSRRTAREIGKENLAKPYIAQAIQEREKERTKALVATREDRLIFLTKIMRDETLPTKDRLRASELLGRAEGDFLVRVEHKGDVGLDMRGEIRAFLLEREKKRHTEQARKAGE